MEITTRIEEENKAVPVENEDLPTLSDAGSTDDELEGLSSFNISTAKKDLYELEECRKIMLSSQMQHQLGIVVGINVSQEFPWKRIKFSLLTYHFFEAIENGDEIQDSFKYKPNDRVLFGYAPSLVKQDEDISEEDPFVLYVSEKGAKAAAAIIRNIEMYERFMMNKNLVKRPRQWVSKGSEAEVDLGIRAKQFEAVDVEIQSVYPMRHSKATFEMRTANDVRDGYAELLPGDVKFQNVLRQRVHVGIQSAPARVTLEQQTDPTFPTNSWAQYLYEIKEGEEEGLDLSSEEEEKGRPPSASKRVTPVHVEKVPKQPLELSKQVKHMLSTLEFNQIDMYRNDYPLISTAPIQIYTNPYLKEIFCFANIAKSNQRYVSAVAWYPQLTGIVVTAYAFNTKVTFNSIQVKDKVDTVQRSILQPNPILMWSFMDSLNFKLEFESPRQITALSFCPYNENLLIGGTINGQIVIWDLQDRAKHLEEEEHLTLTQVNNRELISEFLAWTIQYDEARFVVPAAVCGLECCQTAAITEIKWLSRRHYVTTSGRIQESLMKKKSRYFATLSFDGSLAYWNLDFEISKTAKAAARKNLPAALTQNESAYKKLDKQIKPSFIVQYTEPLTSIICDMMTYTYKPQISEQAHAAVDVKTYPILVEECPQSMLRNNFVVASFFGRIEQITFDGTETDAEVNKEIVISPTQSFARVHDGPLVATQKNPFYPELFVSVGRTVMAIWREDFPFTPILWRVRPRILTDVKWSTDRPAVLFATRIDGSFEAWDLLARDDDACLVEVLGGGIITVLSEHRAPVPKKVISIGDYNSSFRMVALPEGFYHPVPNELALLRTYVEKEVHRKKSLQSWQENWRKQNADIIEERKQAAAEARKDLERLRAEAEAAAKPKEVQEEKKAPPTTSGAHYDLPQKLDKKWDELNLKRLVHNLMSRKKVDPAKLEHETALEKERLRYEERKKASIALAISRVSEEIAAIRARLLPVEKKDVQLSDIIAILVKRIFLLSPNYDQVAEEATTFLEEAPPIPNISFDDIIGRCRNRRALLNKVLGVPYDRVFLCHEELKSGGLKEWDPGCQEFVEAMEMDKIGGVRSSSIFTPYDDLDYIPEKDSEPKDG